MGIARIRCVCLAALVMCLAFVARAEQGAVLSQGNGFVTLDASRLTTVLKLEAPWRFQPSDDAHFADPRLDDSAWPLMVPGSNVSLAAAHVPEERDGRGWARLHLHIVNAHGPLGMRVASRWSDAQFAVIANGKQVGASKGYSTSTRFYDLPVAVTLPEESDVVIAIRFVLPLGGPGRYFHLALVSVGQDEAVGTFTDLQHYSVFDQRWLMQVLLGLLWLAFVPVFWVLLKAQPASREYLWIAIYFSLEAVSTIGFAGTYSGSFVAADWAIHLERLTGALANAALLQYVSILTGFQRRWPVRLGQALQIAFPFAGLFGLENPVYLGSFVLAALVGEVLLLVMLIGGYRRGKQECGLLLIPFILGLGPDIVSILPGLLKQDVGLRFGGVRLSLEEMSSLLWNAGLVAVVLYRFVRISKEEEIAASELQAARTVQDLLLREASNQTPLFQVESVYLPARQVGGDFFLLLPSPDLAPEGSLLAVVGDVSGKGLQAAMVVATIIGSLRSLVCRAPADVLSHLNCMLTGHVAGFATCCAVLLHQDGRMQIANAGNPAPYCDGTELMVPSGLPLGIDGSVEYESAEYVLRRGDRLVFVSDGVIEAARASNHELFGFERTQAVSTESAHAIADAALTFGKGAPQRDDITVVSIAFTG